MSNDLEVRWDRLTAPALRDAVLDRTVVIIPLGAGGTYWYIAAESIRGILGEAWAASSEKGQRLLAAISREVADALADQRLWEAPI